MEPRFVELSQQVRALFREGRDQDVSLLLADLHPADLAEILYELPEEHRVAFLHLLDSETAALVLTELDPEDQSDLIGEIEPTRASDILGEMSSDDIADMVADLDQPEVDRILELMNREEAEEVQELLEFREDSAGGLMTSEFISIHEGDTAQDTIEKLRELSPDAETTYYLYVVDDAERLVGVVSLRELIVAQPNTPIGAIMNRKVLAVNVDMDQEEVARVVTKYHLLAVPVADHDMVLRGIITVDDVIDVIHEEATEDIYRLAATPGKEESVETTAWERAQKRLPWLFILLFGELLASTVIKHYGETLNSILALAFFIPVLIGMGGNVGTQSLAVTVRGLATGELDYREIRRSLTRESLSGVIIGVACGTLVFGVAWAWLPKDVTPTIIGLIVGVSMALDIMAAAVLGTLVPFVLERFKIDPAVASGPFVTTALDVIGMIIYFLVATVFMNYFKIL